MDLFELIRMRIPAAHSADFLIKMNLPPIMGRRDAACDCLGELLRKDLASLPDEFRQQEYARLIRLLTLAVEDTRNLLQMLSNQETRSREEWLFSLFRLLGHSLEPLLPLADWNKTVQTTAANAEIPAENAPDSAAMLTDIRRTEEELWKHLQRLFSSAEVHIGRYREYAAKSFSQPFAERYEKAYREYRHLCQQEL